MAMTKKLMIALAAAAIAAVAGLAVIGSGTESDDVNITDQPAQTTSTVASTTTTADAATTTTAQVFTDPSAVLDEYIRTYEQGDGSAFFAVVTRNFRFVGGTQMTAVTGADQIRNVNNLEGLNWTLERIGETTITGDGPFEITLSIESPRTTTDPMGESARARSPASKTTAHSRFPGTSTPVIRSEHDRHGRRSRRERYGCGRS